MEKQSIKFTDKHLKVDIDFTLAELKHLYNIVLDNIERSQKEEGDVLQLHADLAQKLAFFIADAS